MRKLPKFKLALLLSVMPAMAIAAPVPKDQLLTPPANAAHYLVVSDAGKHGDVWRWQLPDGRTAYRHSQSLRGWITETDQVTTLGTDGLPTKIEVRGITPNGDAAERFAMADGKASWTSLSDSGSVAGKTGYYLPAGGIGLSNAVLIDKLVAAGAAGIELLPSGRATLTMGPGLTIDGPGGPKAVKLAFIRGILAAPFPAWLDDQNRHFADVGGISLFPAGYESVANAKKMRDFQDTITAETVKGIAKQFLTAEARAPVLFDHVRLFDADKGVFLTHQAVLASGGKIVAIGKAGSLKAPAGARVIDGSGKTLVPGI